MPKKKERLVHGYREKFEGGTRSTLSLSKERREPFTVNLDAFGMGHVANLIWTERAYQGQTIKALAKDAGVHPNTLSRMERHLTRSPHAKTIIGIFHALGFDLNLEVNRE